MGYNAGTDFIALLRQINGGVRSERMPGLDWLISGFQRAGLLNLVVSQFAPTSSQATTAWFKTALNSAIAEGVLYLWNVTDGQYEPATPALWSALLTAALTPIVTVRQDVTTTTANVVVNADTVRVMNVGAPVTLTVPLAATKTGDVLITDWANLAGTNPITINLTAPDVFSGGGTTAQIAFDGGSFKLRPVPGGYAL